MTNGERFDACFRANDALSVVIGALLVGDETAAKQYLDEAYTYIDDLYDAYHEFDDDDDDEDDDDEDEDLPNYVTEFISELQDMCEYYEADCKISIDFGDGDCYEVEVSDND